DEDAIPLPSDSVDVAACLVVLEFVFDPRRGVAEIARVLKPRGLLVASVGNIASWKNRFRLLTGRIPSTTTANTFDGAINGGALHMFTQATFRELLLKYGLKCEYTGCSGRAWRFRQKWPSLLAGDILVLARKADGPTLA